jgi:hypothetical protein
MAAVATKKRRRMKRVGASQKFLNDSLILFEITGFFGILAECVEIRFLPAR